MTLPSMVLPLAGGSPSSVMVIVFDDAAMLIYGDVDEDGFLKVDKGNYRRFSFERYPYLNGLAEKNGRINLIKLAVFVNMEKRL